MATKIMPAIKVFNLLQATKRTGIIRPATYKVTGIGANTAGAKKLVLEIYLETVK